MKSIALHLIPILVTFFAGALHALADTQKDASRCFVIIESAGENRGECAPSIKEIWRIGKEAEDLSALQADLKAVGEVKVVKLKTHSVVFVKAGQGDTKALEQVIHIDSFNGSADGLLYRIARESGANWTHARGFMVPGPRTDYPDIYTRITVTDFRGSIRQLLAETIPPSYGSMAMHVHCYPDGAIEVRQPGFLQMMERQFRADHVIGALPKPVSMFPKPQEKEGAVLNKRPAESDAEYRARLDKHMP